MQAPTISPLMVTGSVQARFGPRSSAPRSRENLAGASALALTILLMIAMVPGLATAGAGRDIGPARPSAAPPPAVAATLAQP